MPSGQKPAERLLVVDDSPQILAMIAEALRIEGFEVDTAPDGHKALDLAAREDYGLAIVDQVMPGIVGTEVVRRLKVLRPDIEAIICTGQPSLESSLQAIREHVFDYLCKPCDISVLVRTVHRALERRSLVLENRALLRQLESRREKLESEVNAAKRAIEHNLRNSRVFLGSTAAAGEIRHQVAQVGPSNVNVLLLGESGSGKDVVAEMIHEVSGRSPAAFVKVNCPAIPESLLESEFFGHEAGAFTGANTRKPGRFELATGGTLFLDEIGDLPFSLQAKLLQCVEQKEFYSVGGRKPIQVDARIIAATNAPLPVMVEKGGFRADLFYRLAEYSINLTPLRERKDDIPLLAQHFLSQFQSQLKSPKRTLTTEMEESLCAHDWPGNVRELQTVLRRFAMTGRLDLAQHMNGNSPFPMNHHNAAEYDIPAPSNGKNDPARIIGVLNEVKWNRRKAAEKLGMSYSTLRRRIKEMEITNGS